MDIAQNSNYDPTMPKLFISYRRHDSADATGRLHDRLKAHFGEESVFYDVDSIPIGLDFRKDIEKAVSQCDVLLAVVGEHWVKAEAQDGQRRLDNPNDLVRIEIETALARDIPVVPVLVGHASMPAEADLPGELKGLLAEMPPSFRLAQSSIFRRND